jgi:hypothetical protein
MLLVPVVVRQQLVAVLVVVLVLSDQLAHRGQVVHREQEALVALVDREEQL